jgi:octaprenyl-diphosphate synthase
MLSLKEIQAPVSEHLGNFENNFRASLKSSVPLLDKIMHYIIKRKGKQMRPLFVFLAASVTGGIRESTYRAACLIELLHTATLVHDDVVDDSNLRRGYFSINALWKNKISVLVGDYLLSKGLLFSLENDDYNLLRIVSNAVREKPVGSISEKRFILRSSVKKPLHSLPPAVPVVVLLQVLIRRPLKRCVFSVNLQGLLSR